MSSTANDAIVGSLVVSSDFMTMFQDLSLQDTTARVTSLMGIVQGWQTALGFTTGIVTTIVTTINNLITPLLPKAAAGSDMSLIVDDKYGFNPTETLHGSAPAPAAGLAAGAVVGIAVGCSALAALTTAAAMYMIMKKKVMHVTKRETKVIPTELVIQE